MPHSFDHHCLARPAPPVFNRSSHQHAGSAKAIIVIAYCTEKGDLPRWSNGNDIQILAAERGGLDVLVLCSVSIAFSFRFLCLECSPRNPALDRVLVQVTHRANGETGWRGYISRKNLRMCQKSFSLLQGRAIMVIVVLFLSRWPVEGSEHLHRTGLLLEKWDADRIVDWPV